MADHVDPAESLVLDYEFLVGLRLENDAGVNSIMVRGQMLRANGGALLVRDASDQQVPAQPGARLGQCAQGQPRGGEAGLVLRCAAAGPDVACAPRVPAR